jgi:hypothetical protein
MPASIIPVTGLIQGPIGTISQSDYPLTTNRLITPTDTLYPLFGDAIVLMPGNTYSSVAQYISVDSSSVNSSTPLAFAQANVKTNSYYPTNLDGQQNTSGAYLPGQPCDGFVQGTMTVAVPYGTPSGAGGTVYIRTATNPSYPNSKVGAIEGASLPGNTAVRSDIVFTTGILSTDTATGQIVAQVTLLRRSIP